MVIFKLSFSLKEAIRPFGTDINIYPDSNGLETEFFQRIIESEYYSIDDWDNIKIILRDIATYESNTPEIDSNERKEIREHAFNVALLFLQNNFEGEKSHG